MNNDQEKIRLKIFALMAKTIENGCSEAESMAALQKINELMQEYDLSYTSINDIRQEKYGARRRHVGTGSEKRQLFTEVINGCATHIGKLYDCKCYSSWPFIVYFGSENDTLLAHQTLNLLTVTAESEFDFYMIERRVNGVHGKTQRTSFMAGFISRIRSRIDELKVERTNASSTGTSLIILKSQEVNHHFNIFLNKNKLNLKTSTRYAAVKSEDAYKFGQAAGDKVNLKSSSKSLGEERKIS